MTFTEKAQALIELNLIGCRCIFKEKGYITPVIIQNVTIKDESYNVTMITDSTSGSTFDVGGTMEHVDISNHAIIHGGYVSFFIIFDQANIEEIEKLMNDPQFTHQSLVRIVNHAAMGEIHPLSYYLDSQARRESRINH